jgi:hypothetical protein
VWKPEFTSIIFPIVPVTISSSYTLTPRTAARLTLPLVQPWSWHKIPTQNYIHVLALPSNVSMRFDGPHSRFGGGGGGAAAKKCPKHSLRSHLTFITLRTSKLLLTFSQGLHFFRYRSVCQRVL